MIQKRSKRHLIVKDNQEIIISKTLATKLERYGIRTFESLGTFTDDGQEVFEYDRATAIATPLSFPTGDNEDTGVEVSGYFSLDSNINVVLKNDVVLHNDEPAWPIICHTILSDVKLIGNGVQFIEDDKKDIIQGFYCRHGAKPFKLPRSIEEHLSKSGKPRKTNGKM